MTDRSEGEGLRPHQAGVKPVLLHQLGMGALLDARPSAMATTRSASRTVERRWATMIVVRPGAQPGERLLHGGLALGVERAGRLVEQQDARVAQQGAGQRDALALPAREALAAGADPGREAFRQRGDEAGGRGGARRPRPAPSVAPGRPMRMLAAIVSSNSSVSWPT